MPSIDVAMARSLRGGMWESIAESLDLSSLAARDVSDIKGEVSDAKTAFSSWDNCMNATICKWPVIAIIIVGSLFLLSIIWCIVRCACCGLSCCCECCYCLKCCGNCMGCCDPPRGKRHKYLDNETVPPTNYGYRPEPPMKAPDYGASRAAPSYEPPKYAEFDMGRKGGDDSLPSMPTWDSGGSRKVALEEESVEMNSLNKPANSNQSVASASAAAAASAAAVAAAAGASSPQRRPIPYRHASPMAGGGGSPYASQDPYATNQSGYNTYDNSPYGHAATQSGGGDQYGAVAAVPSGLRRPSPRPDNPYDSHQGHDFPKEAPDYTQTADPYYAPGARQPSPASVAYARTGHSPAPPTDFGQAPQRYGSPAGFRQPYPDDHSSISNTGGFDFNSGYSRTPVGQPFANDSPYDRRGSPAQLTPGNTGYSAYTPYQQQRGAW